MDSSTVAFFGIEGSYTYAAAKEYFGPGATYVASQTFRDVFEAVKSGASQYGMIPIENTLAGSVYENYDLISDYDLRITGEISRKVEHALLVPKHADGNLEGIQRVYSHPKALEQCSLFLDKHSWIKAVPYSDTATAAKFVSESGDLSVAAIADSGNAEIYDLKILKRNLENNGHNYTRFLAIAQHEEARVDGANKCSLMLRLPHVTGSLSGTLSYLTSEGCNLTKIESRPLHELPYEYTFYIDVLIDDIARPIESVIEDLTKKVTELRVLGVYKDERL